jgi:hypothetical protein
VILKTAFCFIQMKKCDICRKETTLLEDLDYCSVCTDCLIEIEDTNKQDDLFKDIKINEE